MISELVNPTRTGLRLMTTEAQHVTPATSTQVPSAQEVDKLYKRLEIEIKGSDPAVLKSYSWFATTAANHLGIDVGKW